MRFRSFLLATALGLGLTVTSPSKAHAVPLTVAVAVASSFATAAAAVSSFVVNAALMAAANWAGSKLLGGKQKASVSERQASVTSLSLGEVPREAVIGMPCVGGSLVDVWNWGGKYGTDNVTRCIALADHAVEDLYGYYVDDTFYPFVGNGVQPGFNGTLTIQFVNGSANGSPPPSIALANGWQAADRMTSVTHVWVTTKYDEKVWTQGHPKFRWVMHGLRVFDPRISAQVWGDRSTHTFSRNATLLRYATVRGIYAEGRQGQPEHLLIGRGLSEEEAPSSRILAPANLCDESIDGLSRYYTDGVISADMDFATVEGMFADAMAGIIVQHEGGVEIEPGQAKATVITITDGDLVAGEPVTFSDFLPDNDGGRINTVAPRYVSPAHNFQDHAGAVRRDLADIRADGGPREMTLPLPLVTGEAVADRNAEITRRLARLERRCSIVLPPECSNLEEGDWIAWCSERYHKGLTVRYRIEGWKLDEKWRMRLSLREIASSVFGVPDPIEDRAEPPPAPVPVDALALDDVGAEAITLAGETAVMPAIRVSWNRNVDAAIRAIRVEVRELGETDAAMSRSEDVGSGVLVVTNGVGADQKLEVRLVPIGDPSRPILPSAWMNVSTKTLIAGGLSLDAAKKLKEDLEAIIKDNDETEKLAEVLLETILNEQDSLEREAAERLEADTGTLIEARKYSDGIADWAEIVFYTRAQTDAGMASTLQVARAYTDAFKSEAGLTFSTKAEREGGDAIAVQQSKAYTDDFKSQASFVYATNAAMAAANAATLSTAQSYADGVTASALNTVYTKAQTDAGFSSTLQAAKAHTDALGSYASLNYGTKTELNGVSAQAGLALSTAVGADNKAKAKIGMVTQVGNLIVGIESENNGVVGSVKVLSSIFQLLSTSSSDRAEFADGIWYFYDGANTARAMVGRPFGGAHKLILWCGPTSVPIGGESKDNAYVYVSMNTVGGGRFGGSDVAGGAAPLAAYTTNEVAVGSRPGGGNVTSNNITIVVTGQGAANAVVRWIKTEEIGATVEVHPNGRSANFTGLVAPGGLTRAIFLAVVTVPGGPSVTVVQDVQLTDSN